MIGRFIFRAAALLILLYMLGYALFVVALPRPAGAERTDAIVVLTGGARRIERGLDLLEGRAARRMFISGVEPTVRAKELAQRYAADDALFACCIELGREAVDTRSNAAEVARWLERRRIRSVRLVTTDWHMPRARYEIGRHVGEGVRILPDAVQSNPSFGTLFNEYNKLLLSFGGNLVGI